MPKTATLELKEGSVKYPSDWIAIHNVDGRDEDCPYAGIVEIRNGYLYHAPTFIFATKTKKAREYTTELIQKVMEACSKSYPGFGHILRMEPCSECIENVDMNNESDVLRIREILTKLPQVNLFCLPVLGDPEFDGTYDPDTDIVIRKNEPLKPAA